MEHANVKLSKNELALVTDKQFILTKNLIIKKVYLLFGELSSDFQNIMLTKNGLLPPEAFIASPKIAKGELYLELPYVVLDYPRFYTRTDVLAIRCFFWWGNFFSITLHLAGELLSTHKPALDNWAQNHADCGWYVSVNTDAWQHHFETDNYIPLASTEHEKKGEIDFGERNFIKLAKKLPLEQWDNALAFFLGEFKELLALLEN